ncbi:hypothetical protein CDL15_Pgr004411 [Punica granatum]|uniref:At2g24240-like C-terminal beta-propeller domain-containing protein n=1 Tax=Punica granatum TaxID=22663 RepID=A0A218XGU9_PUNGR|nr:hypothetical protein CDL15_Pgr004411 [Punica granatum]
MTDKGCRLQLEYYEGQLLLSMNDRTSVHQGNDFDCRTELQRSDRAYIRDFSIGENQLFMLGNKENAFDVWDYPRPSFL